MGKVGIIAHALIPWKNKLRRQHGKIDVIKHEILHDLTWKLHQYHHQDHAEETSSLMTSLNKWTVQSHEYSVQQ